MVHSDHLIRGSSHVDQIDFSVWSELGRNSDLFTLPKHVFVDGLPCHLNSLKPWSSRRT